jgi:REP element-mobilizing transposase RayT
VTLRARLAALRSQHVFPTIRLALLRAGRRYPESFGLLHFSVQRDHLHLVVEAKDKRSLSSGIRSIAIRVARYVNDLLSRRGSLWADRFHSRALKSPSEVRNALVYVLANFRKHARRTPRAGIDPFSSGAWFDGWREWKPTPGRAPPWAAWAAWRKDWDESPFTPRHIGTGQHGIAPPYDNAARRGHGSGLSRVDEPTACVVSAPRSWLATIGWRRRGLIALNEPPRG